MLITAISLGMGETARAEATDDDAVAVESFETAPGEYTGYKVETGTGAMKTLKLLKNIEGCFALPGKWTLDLNGYGIRMPGDGPAVIYDDLIIIDSDPTKIHYVKVDENGRGVSVKNSGTESDDCFKVEGGYITGSNLKESEDIPAAAVSVTKGGSNHTLIIFGGTIIGNAFDPSDPDPNSGSVGGGVYVGYADFTMHGGTICHNRAKNGGGVYVNNGKFTMYNGTIRDNTATGDGNGGGVYLHLNGSATIGEGTISGNSAKNGGGVYVCYDPSSTFEMSGGMITDNTAEEYGGGIIGSNIKINGGKITGNRAGSNGGGVSGAPEVSGKPVITDNHVGNIRNNVDLGTYKMKISDTLDKDARIGITFSGTPTEFLTGADGKDYSKQIFTDDESKSVEFKDGKTVISDKPTPNVKTAPAAIEEVIYNGKDQDIFTPGEVNREDCKLLYAKGEDDVNVPSDGSFTEEIPKGKDAGDYYVWYRIEGYPEKVGAVKAAIGHKDIKDAEITFKYDLHENGKEQEQKIETVSVDGIYLTAGTDYTVDASSKLKATQEGSYRVQITGKGNFTGSAEATWILKKSDTGYGISDYELTDAMSPYPNVDIDKKNQPMYLIKGQKFTMDMFIGWTMESQNKKNLSLNAKGAVKAKKPIESFEIKSADGNRTISVNICDPKLSEKKIKLEAGGKKSVSFNGKNAALPEHWITDKPDVATVNDSGEITAVSKGKATITAYVCGKPFKCKVTVTETKAAPERTLHLTQGDKGKKLALKGVKNPGWKTVSENDADKVEVVKGKTIKGLKTGKVSMNSVDGAYKAEVFIEDPTLKTEGIKEGKKNRYTLDMKLYQETKIIFNEMYQDVTFISNKPEIAHDNGHGVLRPMAAGTAKLTAKINGKKVTITVKVEG